MNLRFVTSSLNNLEPRIIEVDASNWSSYFCVLKLLRFGFHKIMFF